ncbi:MAG TPA: hypothetical protein VHE35_33890 [Kofleriaceae bacterium]|nr:hypothetical protein [Kofleriaceae bacterium]
MTRTPGLWAMIAIGIEVTGCAGRAAHATAPAGGALRNRPAPSSGKASARHALARARQYL